MCLERDKALNTLPALMDIVNEVDKSDRLGERLKHYENVLRV